MPVKVINRSLIYFLLILIYFLKNALAELDSITSLLSNGGESQLNESIAPNRTPVDGFQVDFHLLAFSNQMYYAFS